MIYYIFKKVKYESKCIFSLHKAYKRCNKIANKETVYCRMVKRECAKIKNVLYYYSNLPR